LISSRVVQQKIVTAVRQLSQLEILAEQQTNNLTVTATQLKAKEKNLKVNKTELTNLVKKNKRNMSKEKKQLTVNRKKCETAKKANEKLTNAIEEEREKIENICRMGMLAVQIVENPNLI
jgi:hypothetical protein